MPSSDWVPLATTALGGALASGGGFLAQWWNNRRADARTRADYRRGAYAAFLGASDGFQRAVTRPGSMVEEAAGTLDHAYTAVTLSGPAAVISAADHVREQAWSLMDWCDDQPEHATKSPEFPLISGYMRARTQFTEAAQKALGS